MFNQIFMLITVFCCFFLTGCSPNFETDRYFESQIHLAVDGITYSFTRNWVCETHNGLSANDMRFHPVTNEKPRNENPYTVKTLNNGMILIYRNMHWCEKKNFSPETLEITLFDRLINPTYGQHLSLKPNSSIVTIDKHRPNFNVSLIDIDVFVVKEEIETTIVTEQEKAALKTLQKTADAYQEITIGAWRHDPESKKTIAFEKQLLKKRDDVWDAEDIDFPSEIEDYRNSMHRSFAFTPLSRAQLNEKIKNKEQVKIRFNGELLTLSRGQDLPVKSNLEDFDKVAFDYSFNFHEWYSPTIR